jgi:DNA-binding Lrp family transcriptional regulator
MEREFLGVWIPKEIYLNKELTPTDKLLLAEITSLAKNGECFASNQHFSEFLGISKSQVSRLITKLVRLNFISVVITYKELTKEVDKRVITPIGVKADTPTHGRVYPLRMEAHTPTHERVDPMRVDAYYKEQVKEQYKEQVKDIKKTKQKNVSAELENEFELLWKKYPRKLGKANALKAYIKARKGNKTTYETIENGLYRYIDYLKSKWN